jgi:outer membrane receptor protein involved in Fe transport
VTKDLAVFGEVTYNITDKIGLIFGGRYYDQDISRDYFVRRPGSRLEDNPQPSNSDSGFLPKGGIQYSFDDDKMVYALRSEGYRTGGINRSRGMPTLPFEYDSDKLINYEAGAKTQWMDGRVQVNITGYHQIWKNYQLEVTDPSFNFGQPFQTVVTNVGDATIDGIDFDITAIPAAGLEVGLSGTHLFKNATKDAFVVADPRSPGAPVLDLPAGTRLPLVADWNLAGYAQYGWPINVFGGSDAFVRFQFSYTGNSLNKVEPDGEPNPQLIQPSYIIGDMRAGIGNEQWEMEVYVSNLWDERAVINHPGYRLNRFYGQDRVVTNRPRNIGLRIKRHFN